MFVEIAVDLIIDRERGCLIAASKTGHIAHRNFFRAAAKSLLEPTFQVGSATQMAGHIGADAHFSLGWRCEMKVGIKTGHRMDLAERHLNLCGEIMQPVGRQIAKLVLNGPKFVDHTPGSSCLRDGDRFVEILASNVRRGEWRTWGRPSRHTPCRRFRYVPCSQLFSRRKVGISKTIAPENVHGRLPTGGVANCGLSDLRLCYCGTSYFRATRFIVHSR